MRINLLPKNERPLESYAMRWEFVAIFFGIVLLLVFNGYGLLQVLTVRSLKYEHEQAVDHSLLLQMQRNKVITMQASNNALKTKLDYYEEITNVTNTNISMESLTLIMESIPENIWLEDLDMQSSTIFIRGYTFNTATVSQFLQNLTNRGFQATVKQLDQLSVGNLTSFVIEVERR